jgi:hypothetical protein
VDGLSLPNPGASARSSQEGQGEVDALDLVEPAFGFSVLAPKDQVRLISSRC